MLIGCETPQKFENAISQLTKIEKAKVAPIDTSAEKLNAETEIMIAAQKAKQSEYSEMKKSLSQTFKRLAVKYPNEVRQLASSPKQIRKMRKVFLKEFKAHKLTKDDLMGKRDALLAKLELYYMLNAHKYDQQQYTVNKQTLQMVSQDLYYTTRRWPELFLLNLNQIKHWDKVRNKTNLRVYLARDPEKEFEVRKPTSDQKSDKKKTPSSSR